MISAHVNSAVCHAYCMNLQGITLVEPTARFRTAFLAMAEEYLAAGDERYKSAFDDFSAYLVRLMNATRNVNLPLKRVPENNFWLVYDNRVLGRSRLRHRLTTDLEHEGGHIGYDIRPSERQKGYGTLILALTLEKAKDLGLNRVLLTCDRDNIGSVKIIEKNGGVLSGQAISKNSGKPISQYWIKL